MQKLAKRLSVVMALLMTLSILTSFGPVAKAATLYPQVQYAQEPQLEYTVGDRVSFNLYTPNYGGRVQYRVVLWNDETKSYKDLWNTPDRYYDKWMPYGNNIFTLGWVINEPGHYRITIYAKRAGITNNECYLKGFNCDSYMESDSFVVKAKETPAVETPVIPATSLALTDKTKQVVVGQEYEVKAKVDKAGVKVIFNIDAAADSMNKDLNGEAISDASGIATFKYTRQYGDADFVVAYSAAAPAVRDFQKVYWGVAPILTINGIDKDDVAKVTNGSIKQYKVKLVNPVTGEPMRYKEIRVMLKENIDTDELKSTAILTNDFNGEKVTPYQRKFNIATGGLNEVSLQLMTNDNGEASFTVTGYNTDATPIVFYDAFQFFNEMPAAMWLPQYMYMYEQQSAKTYSNDYRWFEQLMSPIGLPDTGAMAASYAGDHDYRLDPVELQAVGKTVTFITVPYTITGTMDGGKYVAVYDHHARALFEDDNEDVDVDDDDAVDAYVDGWLDIVTGREYTVTVTKPDGKPFVNANIYARIEQLFDNKLNSDTDARIIAYNKKGLPILADSVVMTTDSKGKASFTVVSPTKNDIATPRVWIDQDTPVYQGHVSETDARYTDGEPTLVLDTIYFVNEAVASADFTADFDDANIDDANTDADDNFVNLGGAWTDYTLTVYDQNNAEYLPENGEILVTYTLFNDGKNPIRIKKPAAEELVDVQINRHPMLNYYLLQPGETITMSGTHEADDDWDGSVVIQARTEDNTKSGKLVISVQATTTVADDRPWWLPSNTTDAELGKATLTTYWVAYKNVPQDYDGKALEVSGTVEFINTTDNYVVIKSAAGSYYRLNYEENGPEFFSTRLGDLDEDTFEALVDLDLKIDVLVRIDGSWQIKFAK